MDDRLYRSRVDRMLTGVAGGLAERLDVDPALVRVVWAVSMPLTGFLTLLIYIVMALVVPDEPPYGVAASAGQVPPTGPPPGRGATDPTSSAGGPAAAPEAGKAQETGAAPAAQPPAAWAQDWRSQRAAWRAQRRAERSQRHGGGGAVILGIILVGLGILFLAQQVIPAFDWELAWPIVVIGLGIILIAGSLRRG
ncbi:MAG: PspC domain-containing protein [Candidatus Limnocylindrales bacterium]